MAGLSLFLVFVTSLMFTFAIIPLVLRLAHSKQLYDHPDVVIGNDTSLLSRRVHTQPMPRLGGIGIVVGFFISTFLWASPTPFLPLYFASLLMFVVGVVDDLRPLSAKLRLVVQVGIAVFVVYYMKLPLTQLIFTPDFSINLPLEIGYPLSVFIIVGAINAINLTDGLDGLAGGIVMIGIVLLSILYFLTTKDLNLIFCLSLPLLGSLLGFLKYNTHPASIFMGDGGSNWLGLMTGVLLVFVLSGATLAGSAHGMYVKMTTVEVPFLSAILCIVAPVLDTAFVMARRLMAGKNPMTADKTHFHHTLLFIGLSHSQSVTAIYFLSLVVGALGLMPVAYPAYNLSWVCFVGIGIWLVILSLSLRIDENAAERILKFKRRIFLNSTFRPIYRRGIMALEIFNRYLIYGILSVVPLVAGIPHSALGYAALICLILIIAASFAKEKDSFFQSFVISIASTVLLTAINFNTLHVSFLGTVYNIQYLYNAIFILLLGSTLLYILLTLRRRYFVITPTDFLMISLPFCLLFVPEPYQTEFKLNIISLRSLIFFIAVRVLTRRYVGGFRRVKFMCGIGLLYVLLVSVCGLRIIY